MRGGSTAVVAGLWALCGLWGLFACSSSTEPGSWKAAACGELALREAPPATISLVDVQRSANATVVLWQGWSFPDDPLLLSVGDASGWRAPLRLREHADAPLLHGLTARELLLLSQDAETREPLVPDAGVGIDDTFDTQLTLVGASCDESALGRFRAGMYLTPALTRDGLAVAAWNENGAVRAVVAGRGHPLERTTLLEASSMRPSVSALLALTDGAVLAVISEHGGTECQPKRILSRRYAGGAWSEPVVHLERDCDADAMSVRAAAGPDGSAALLTAVDAFGETELRLTRAGADGRWSEPVTVARTTDLVPVQLLLGRDERAAVLFADSGRFFAQLYDGVEPFGETTSPWPFCDCAGPASAAFDEAGRLVVAWEREDAQAELAAFDGERWYDVQTLGTSAGAVTQPTLAASPEGHVLAVWKQHDGPQYRAVGDQGVLTPSVLMSAEIVEGRPERVQPLVRPARAR